MDVCAGDGWETLCSFLGRPVPAVPFPRNNVRAGVSLKIETRRCFWMGVAALHFGRSVGLKYMPRS